MAIVGVPGIEALMIPTSPGAMPVEWRNIFWPFGQNDANSLFQVVMTSCGVTLAPVSRTVNVFW